MSLRQRELNLSLPPPPLTQQQQLDNKTLANPQFWQDVHTKLRQVKPVAIKPNQTVKTSVTVDGWTIILTTTSKPTPQKRPSATPMRTTTSGEKFAVSPEAYMLPQCEPSICTGSFTASISAEFYNGLGMWVFTLTYHDTYSWNSYNKTDYLAYPYWTFSHAGWAIIYSVTYDQSYVSNFGTDWYSSGSAHANVGTQWIGFTVANVTGTAHLYFVGDFPTCAMTIG